MENATKALLIAAAVLIAILIITLALVAYRMAAETMGNVNLSEAEMAQFNGKFDAYAGTSVSGSSVNAMLSTVFTHNQSETSAGTNRHVTVKYDAKTGADNDSYLTSTSTTITKVSTAKYYTVELSYSNGIVNEITIKEK